MTSPGSNLLRQALRVIRPQPFEYYRARERVINTQFREVVGYEAMREIWGSPQPLSSARVIAMGLQATKNYVIFYASENFATPSREGAADVFQHGGKRYEAVDGVSWVVQDGWEGVVAVEVGPAGIVGPIVDGD